MDINCITLSGRLSASITKHETENCQFGYFSIVTHINKRDIFVRVLLFDENLNKSAERFLIKCNFGKRLCISGILSDLKNDGIQVIAKNFFLIDSFADAKKIAEEAVNFCDDERILDKGIRDEKQ